MNATQLKLIERSQQRTATTIRLGLGYVLAAAKSGPKEAHKRPDIFEWICDVDGCGQIFLVKASEVSLDDPSIWKWLQGFVDQAQQAAELVEVAEAAIAACSPCKGSGQYVAQLTGGAKETRTCPLCAKARAAVAKALALRNQI
jgi:hypothetical protein